MLHPRLIDHFQHPRNVGELPPPSITVEVGNPVCGDILRISAKWESGRVAEAGFRTRGCTASIATGSALTELMIGRSAEQLEGVRLCDIEAAVGELSAESKHAAVLCIDALKKLLQTVRS